MAALCTPASPAEAQQREYRQTIQQALREFQAGHWEESRVLFEQAHALSPSARTLRGIGMSAFEMRDYVEAYRTLGEALESETRPLTARLRRETEALRERAGSFVAYLFVETVPEDANVSIDLEPVMKDREGNVLVNVGEHSVQVEAEGYQPQTQRFTAEGGQGQRLRIVLERVPPPPPPPPPEGPDPFWPIVAFGSAGAFAIGTAVGIGWFVYQNDELEKCRAAAPAMTGTCANEPSLAGKKDTALALTLVMSGLTLAAAGTGLVLLLLGRDDDESAESSLLCVPALGGISCVGRF